MPTSLRPTTPQLTPKRKKSSSKTTWVVILLLLLAGGGGAYYWHAEQQAEQARIKLEEQKARREARRKAREAEEARRKAAAEAAERERAAAEEQARRLREQQEAEEAARKKAAAEEEQRLRQAREAEEAERRKREAEAAAEAERLRRQKAEQEGEKPVPSFYEATPPLVGGECNSPESRQKFDAIIDHLVQERDFDAFARVLSERIRESAPELIQGDKLIYNNYKRRRNLVQAMDLCLLIDMAGAEQLSALLGSQPKVEYRNGADAPQKFLLWMLRDKSQPLHTLMQSFIFHGGDSRNMAHAFHTLFSLWDTTPEKERAPYLRLAVACSILHPAITQSRGMVRNPNGPLLSIQDVYHYFRSMDAQKKLLTDMKKLSVSDLLYVVDVRLPRSEFDWVHENLTYKRAQWGEAYASIRYRMDRAAVGEDPYENYTFAELRKKGGVCRDQGYFACTTAKCKGIPAVYITGDGDRGGHAWIATLVDDVSWKQTGSYGYKTGRFQNTCSCRIHHESVLLNRDKKTTDEKLAPAADAMLISEYLVRIGCRAEALSTARYITSAFPLLTAAWVNRIQILSHKDNETSTETWRKIDADLMRFGRKNGELIDLAAEIEEQHLMSGKSLSSRKSAMARSMDKLKRTVGNERSDLIVEAVERQGRLLAEAHDLRGLSALYKKQLKAHTGRGDIFEQLLHQYMYFIEGEDEAVWAAMAKDVDKIFTKNVLTNTQDLFKLRKEVAIQQMIAEAWKRGGNTKKADKLREEAEIRLQNATSRYGTPD